MDDWVGFHRADAAAVIDLVRDVARARDAGEYGHGVEVVVEAPRRSGLLAWFNRDDPPAQARIVVTRSGGEVGYPFDIQLVTDRGGDAAHIVGARPGWAVSNSAGLAFLVQKRRADGAFDFGGLVGTAVAALSELEQDAPDDGWRARVNRRVLRGPS